MKFANFVFETIKENFDIEKCFAVTGDYVKPLIDQISDQFEVIHCSSEIAASFAAIAQSRIQGLGIFITSYGVGIHSILGLATAFSEKDRLILISIKPPETNQFLLHHKISPDANDQSKIYSPVTVEQCELDPTNLTPFINSLEKMVDANRPILLEFPRNSIDQKITEEIPSIRSFSHFEPVKQEALDQIKKAKNPFFLLGKLTKEQRERLRELKATKCYSPLGRGFGMDDKWTLGTYMGEITPNLDAFIRKKCDLLVAIGLLNLECEFGRGTYFKQPDLYLENLSKTEIEEINKCNFKNLKNELPKYFSQSRYIDQIFFECSKFIDLFYCCDVSNAALGTVNHQIPFLLHSPHFLPMGSSMGFALGVHALGYRSLIIIGDGAFQSALSDLTTFRKYGWHPIIILLNNWGYSFLGVESPSINYRLLIESFNGDYYLADSVRNFKKYLMRAKIKRNRMALIEVRLSPQPTSELEVYLEKKVY